MKKILTNVLAIGLAITLAFLNNAPSYAYTVKEGDSLWKIARENGISVSDILKWNDITDRDLIYPGKELVLNGSSTNGRDALSAEEIEILSKMFDAEYYAKQNPDVVNAYGTAKKNLFNHFCTYGLYELRQPNIEFNVAAYAAAYDDLSAAFGTDVVSYYKHLYKHGKEENRTLVTMEALAATGVNVEVLKEQQSTVKDKNGRPQFNAFYSDNSKDFEIPEESHLSTPPSTEPANIPPSGKVFKAVYNTNNSENSLTFYYDDVDHSGMNISVYNNLPLEATSLNSWPYNSMRESINEVKVDSSVSELTGLKSIGYMFANLKNATTLDGMEYLNTSNVTNMDCTFIGFARNVTTFNEVPNVSGWDTSKVTNMKGTFNGYAYSSSVLNKVPDVSNWNTENVTTMQAIFNNYGYASSALDAVPNVRNWNTAKVQNLQHSFADYGESSTELSKVPDVSSWNTGSATTLSSMFYHYGKSSTKLNVVPNVSGWNTANVTNVGSIFANYGATASNPMEIDVRSWTVGDGCSIDNLFKGSKIMTYTFGPDWDKECDHDDFPTFNKINGESDKNYTYLNTMIAGITPGNTLTITLAYEYE